MESPQRRAATCFSLSMYDSLLQRLNELVPLNVDQQKQLCQLVQVSDHPKDDVLVEKGEVCDRLYFVVAGVLRSATDYEDKEVTRWLCFADHFATAYFSFTYRQPSEDTICALTDVKLLSISYHSLQYLIAQDTIWVDLNRRLLEHYYTILLERVMSFQTQSTAERYERLLDEQPTIEDEVPLGCIASYLGMTQETLSRIRRRRKGRS